MSFDDAGHFLQGSTRGAVVFIFGSNGNQPSLPYLGGHYFGFGYSEDECCKANFKSPGSNATIATRSMQADLHLHF